MNDKHQKRSQAKGNLGDLEEKKLDLDCDLEILMDEIGWEEEEIKELSTKLEKIGPERE